MSLKMALLISAAFILAGISFALGRVAHPEVSAVRAELAALHFKPYAPQKVVYHVDDKGGFFDHAYLGVLKSIRNHVDAVGAENIDLRVVFQSNGLKLLADANTNNDLRQLVDELRGKGVRFLVCRNSLMEADESPTALYGVMPADIVQAAVAEIAALEAQGFVYIHM